MRLLLDDLNTVGTDPTLALLASHPNVELRLYNPFVSRGSRTVGFLADFTRLNHRMHNKSFTVDSVVTVVGGRNIADEYYEIGDNGLVDLDVLAIGDAVRQVSAEFDLFWNSASAYPAKLIIGTCRRSRTTHWRGARRRFATIRSRPSTRSRWRTVAGARRARGHRAPGVDHRHARA